MIRTQDSASALRSTRELRALALAEEHFEEIAASYRRGTYAVPASGGGTYAVRYTRREESCECKDWEYGHTCYHLLTAAVVAAKTRTCAGCGQRVRRRELVDVGGDNLTFFEGDRLCRTCARRHGVL